jgi:hypothetical protein
MSTSAIKADPTGIEARVDDDTLYVRLNDGRELTVPLAWFLRLLEASSVARRNWRWIGGGVAIHWPDLDEDISIRGLLRGQ